MNQPEKKSYSQANDRTRQGATICVSPLAYATDNTRMEENSRRDHIHPVLRFPLQSMYIWIKAYLYPYNV